GGGKAVVALGPVGIGAALEDSVIIIHTEQLVLYELQILDFLELSLTSVDAKMGRSTEIACSLDFVSVSELNAKLLTGTVDERMELDILVCRNLIEDALERINDIVPSRDPPCPFVMEGGYITDDNTMDPELMSLPLERRG
ncbi:hypothetical protein HID58_067308, partial [Brassica napus]